MRIFPVMMFVAASAVVFPRDSFAADGLPNFDITRNCKAETADTSGIGETLASCTSDEQRAKDWLSQQWTGFSKQDKAECIRETSIGDTPSYVELQICLQISADKPHIENSQ